MGDQLGGVVSGGGIGPNSGSPPAGAVSEFSQRDCGVSAIFYECTPEAEGSTRYTWTVVSSPSPSGSPSGLTLRGLRDLGPTGGAPLVS